MKLNKKTLTKLLDANYRKSILFTLKKDDCYIADYAHYVVDSQIMYRAKEYENDKSAYYGFSPINVICAVLKDNTVEQKFFEFNTINHFLKLHQAEYAVEVVMCILILWKQTDRRVKNFNVEVIDAELAKVEKEMTELAAKRTEDEATKATTGPAKENEPQTKSTGGYIDSNGNFIVS